MKKMLKGNQRFVLGLKSQADVCAKRRNDTASAQHPYAAVVACSDSRVPVEYIFDMGIGDLFIIRVAGNVIGVHEAESLKHAVEKLHVPLILILGHTGCEAVSAALSVDETGDASPIIKKILPAADRARAQNRNKSASEILHAACIENVYQAISDLLKLSPVIKAAAADHAVTVAGALYDIETGEVAGLDA